MRVLYGVQGTGNGHISRARAMAPALARAGVEVDWLFSGRPRDRFFHMDEFGDFGCVPGLTFVVRDGQVDYTRTVLRNRYLRFVRDVLRLDLDPYDLVLTDFEPVAAWAGKLRRKVVISMGHQPAFDHPVPVAGRDMRTALVMRLFAPGTVRVGMHWDHFGAPLLPPLVDVEDATHAPQPRKVVVYLPFEDPRAVTRLLAGIPDFDFYVYSPASQYLDDGHLRIRPTSLEGFRADLADCESVICNAGFELSSECLTLGKRLLVKPVERQMEQVSNALALQTLGYGSVLRALDASAVHRWLVDGTPATRISFPAVADVLSQWICRAEYSPSSLQALSDSLWQQVKVIGGEQASLLPPDAADAR